VSAVEYRYNGYEIKSHPGIEAGTTWYSVYSPEGELVLGNRDSLEKAEKDLQDYISTGGYKKWEDIGVLLDSETSIRGMDVDPEVRELVRDLNVSGYVTVGSCAGHSGIGGFITLKRTDLTGDEKEEIRDIFRSHGIGNLGFTIKRNLTSIGFPRIG